MLAIRDWRHEPEHIDRQNHANPLKVGDSRAQKIVDYMSKITSAADLKTTYGPVIERLGFAYSRVV